MTIKREHGTVATFNGSYAFLKPDAADRDVFAHVSQLPRRWRRVERLRHYGGLIKRSTLIAGK